MKKLVVANWKMNGNKSSAENFIQKINIVESDNEIVLCLPYPYLYLGSNQNFTLGGQDCHAEERGSFTGDVSASMLWDIGCRYVIIGHSERRRKHKETNQMVKEKALSALRSNLIPIICVGEKNKENLSDLQEQCKESLCSECIIAYEPIWAIGQGITPSIKEIQDIAYSLQKKYSLPVIYGGSVDQKNALQIIKIPCISGLLIGKSSLSADIFIQIINNLT